MQTKLSESDQAFSEAVEAFLTAHGPHGEGAEIWLEAAWCQALLDHGFNAPGWPVSVGGGGFTPTQKHIWYNAANAHIPGFAEPLGLAVAGPLIARFGRDSHSALLASIVALEGRWGVSLDPEGIELSETDGQHFAHGVVAPVQLDLGDGDAHVLLAASKPKPQGSKELYLLILNTADVPSEPVSDLAGNQCLKIDLDRLPIEETQQIPLLASPWLDDNLISMAHLPEQQMAAINAALTDEPVGSDLLRRRNELAIELAGLKSLAERWVDAQTRGVETSLSAELIALKSTQLESALGSLLVDCFGYYALPYPDMWLSHNEGEVGTPGARLGIATYLSGTLLGRLHPNFEDALYRDLSAAL